MTRVAIVGCGAAGAATAYALSASEANCVVFERRGSVGGRAASRTRETAAGVVTYDYGANYLKDDDERVVDLVHEVAAGDDRSGETRTGGSVEPVGPTDTPGPIYTFDAEGVVSPGRESDDHKWSTPAGVDALVERVVAASDATVETDTPVRRLRTDAPADAAGGTWTVETADGERSPFDAVVLTPPAPVTADLLAESAWDTDARDALVRAARGVSSATVWSVVAGYERSLDRPYYALVGTSDDHRAGWIARESCKPGHVPGGETLVVQGGHDWSARNADRDPETVTDALVRAATDVIGESWLADPDWTDAVLWRHALPEEGVLPGPVRDAERNGLYVAGDWVAGEARLHAALRSGLDIGERLAYAL